MSNLPKFLTIPEVVAKYPSLILEEKLAPNIKIDVLDEPMKS